jgi:hypothetical protein
MISVFPQEGSFFRSNSSQEIGKVYSNDVLWYSLRTQVLCPEHVFSSLERQFFPQLTGLPGELIELLVGVGFS